MNELQRLTLPCAIAKVLIYSQRFNPALAFCGSIQNEVGCTEPGREVWPNEAGSDRWSAEAQEEVSKMEPKELEPKMGYGSLESEVFGDFNVS